MQKQVPFFNATKQPKLVADLESARKIYEQRLESIKGNKNATISKVSIRKSTTPDAATITLNVVGDPYGDGAGFQMFLDPDCEFNWMDIWYYGQFFDVCEYHIPEDATPEEDLTQTSVVLNESESITVPQGYYNFIILNINTDWNQAVTELWAGTFDQAVADNFYLKNGFEYVFTVEAYYDEVYQYTRVGISYNPEYDAALVGLTVPEPSSSLTNSESITVRVANYSIEDISSVNLSYQINNGDIVTESYSGTISVGGEQEYTFNTKADFSAAGIYSIKAWVTYDNDLDSRNDAITAATKHTAPIELPFINEFDNPAEFLYWTVYEGSENATWGYDYDNFDADGNIGSVQVYKPMTDQPANSFLVSDPLNFVNAGNYNIRFQFKVFGEESLRILCGKTPNPSEMDTIEDFPFLHGYLWDFRPINFTIDEAGIHYVAFQYYSQPGVDPDPDEWGEEGETTGGVGMIVDNIIVDTGNFVGIPDLEIVKVVSPASACDMADESTIRVRIKNTGTEPISEMTLSYQINDDTIVEELIEFSLWNGHPLGINEEATEYFSQKYDFSALGEYTIKIVGTAVNDKNDENDTFVATVIHYEPLTVADLPFVSDFMNPDNRKEWSSTEVNGWMPNTYQGCLWPERVRVPLLSRCITLEPGTYRFDYGYTAGWEMMGLVFTDNFYVTYGKVGEDPLSWDPVKSYTNKATFGAVTDDEIVLNITEQSEYMVA
ncbi:MAG: DUF2436 domain-containing protein, partial [Tannerellaceae bacterium]|nr:DUF2436 domain-containing protein [Tannerellaceae bacterium]